LARPVSIASPRACIICHRGTTATDGRPLQESEHGTARVRGRGARPDLARTKRRRHAGAQARAVSRETGEGHTLSVSISDDGSERVVELFGELDAASVDTLIERLGEAMDGRFQTVIVDLSGLDFIDSCGIAAIYRAVEASRANGTRLGLLRGSAEV